MNINKFKNIWNSSIDNAIKNIEEGKHLSKFKIKPVPPKEFFEVWLKQPLFPMQYEVLNQVFTNNYMDWNTNINEIILCFGEGCISKDTLIKDVITKEQHTVSQWCRLNKQFHVLAYDFETASWKVVLADVPFKKGRAKIYKVVVRDPSQKKHHTIKCTKEHRFYTPRGWKELKDLKVGDLVATYNSPSALESTWSAEERKQKLGSPGKSNPNYGKKASPEKRLKISLGIRNSKKYKAWLNSDKRKKLLKKYSLLKRINNYKRQTHIFEGSGRCKWERYYSPIAGEIKIQGELEKRFARYLDRKGYNWRRNLRWFYYKDETGRTRQYQPDFLVIHNDGSVTFYEVKGYLTKRDLLKLEAVRQQGYHIVLIQKGTIKKLNLGKIDLPKNDSHLIFKPIEKIEYVGEDDYYDFNVPIYHNYLLHGILHHNSGKDYTIVRTLVYVCYWLNCLNYPQEYFRVGKDTPIVIANMSVNEDHAINVFFSQFTTCLRSVINPATGRNFFEELGVDLREGKDIQTRRVKLPNHIEAYSLDSARYAGEGKNILFAVFDEIAEFRFDKAKQRYDNLKNTAFSRFPERYKIAMLSYPRDEYDFLMTHMKEVQNWPEELKSKVYIKVAAPWEVRSKEGAHPDLIKKRLYKTKADYIQIYRTDPIEAMRRYECKFPKTGINRFLKKFDIVLSKCVNFDRSSPFIWESIGKEKEIYLTEKELNEITLQPWFKNTYTYEIYQLEQKLLERPNDEQLKKKLELELQKHENAQYFIHIDLSRGIKDCAGLAVIHPYFISSTITGYYVDLVIQIRPEDVEIDFEEIRRFIFKLNDRGFDIAKVTLDGFQSADFCQIVKKRGIDSEIISVDRSKKPYDTFKSLLYQGKVNMYNYLVLVRELKELIVTPKGKVDHPEESQQRLKEEGLKEGSKDCSDAICGAIYTAVLQEAEFGPTIVDESDLETPDVEDIL